MGHQPQRPGRRLAACREPWLHLPDLDWLRRQTDQFKRPLKETVLDLAHDAGSRGTIFCYLPRPNGGLPMTFVW